MEVNAGIVTATSHPSLRAVCSSQKRLDHLCLNTSGGRDGDADTPFGLLALPIALGGIGCLSGLPSADLFLVVVAE